HLQYDPKTGTLVIGRGDIMDRVYEVIKDVVDESLISLINQGVFINDGDAIITGDLSVGGEICGSADFTSLSVDGKRFYPGVVTVEGVSGTNTEYVLNPDSNVGVIEVSPIEGPITIILPKQDSDKYNN